MRGDEGKETNRDLEFWKRDASDRDDFASLDDLGSSSKSGSREHEQCR